MKRFIAFLTALLLLTAAFPFAVNAYDVHDSAKFTFKNKDTTLPYRLILPESYSEGKEYPMIVFFHGAGERGNDNELQFVHCVQYLYDNAPEDCIILAPQCPTGNQWVDTPWKNGAYSVDKIPESNEMKAVVELIAELEGKYSIDSDRIYAAGLSMGGFATWDAIMRHNDLFAAAVPVCGGGDPSKAELLKFTPIFTFHAVNDPDVPYSGTRDTVNAIKEVGGTKIEYTEYSYGGHGIWNQAFATEGLLEKLFGCRLSDRAFLNGDGKNNPPKVIPAVREWEGATDSFTPNASTKLVNPDNVKAIERVKDFFKEMASLDLDITDKSGAGNEILFRLDETLLSQVGKEGYILEATKERIVIRSGTDIGLLYGGITVVQSVTADKAFPCGTAIDYPEYEVRSGMLDVGRAWIPLDYVEEITRYMAYFKMNEIHLHINDDGSNNYSGFRLESDIKGLSSKDGYYTKDEYRAYQKKMLEYGVSVVTEIDTPFHSSCYKNAENPPPYLPGNNRCLDISKPETLEFVKNLFAEYMTGDDPVFVGKVVHIGTDEYPREYAELMRKYTDDLIDYVNSLGYTPRFWGGLGEEGFQGETPISENAQMNFWDLGISGMQETLESDFDVINTVNNILYTVPTTNYSFPDYYDLEKLYNKWQVNYFDLNQDSENRMVPGDERLLGASFALWNDLHTEYKGVTRFDIFDRLRGMVCLVAEKTWCGMDTANRYASDFISRYETLSLRAGDADPGRHSFGSEGVTLDFEGDLPSGVTANGKIENGEFVLDGSSYLSFVNIGLGFPNTLEFDITLDEATKAPIFAGDGCEIFADADGKGNFGFKSEFYTFTYDYKLPIGEKTRIRLTSDGVTTYLTVNDYLSYNPKNARNLNGTKLATLTVPLEEIGKGIKGKIDNISLIPEAVEEKKLLANYNLALGTNITVSGLEVYDGRLNEPLAVDGDEKTRLSFARDKDEQWLICDLGDVYDVACIEIAFFEHISAYELYVSEDGKDYQKVYSVSGAAEQVKQTDTIVLDKTYKARYVKYVQLKRWYYPAWNAYYSGGISEFRVFSFHEATYRELITEAKAYCKKLSTSGEAYKKLNTLITELEKMLAEDDIFVANADYYYNEIRAVMNGDLGDDMLGDINGNGTIDQYDYILVKRHHFETRKLTEDELLRADVNRDGTVNTYDYLLIARHYFGTYVIK
ncbi:MAG: family 20 glycosylhydrolase [Clostridia bacterium]|nr:family 20 glycosylhydrolase [Clostridia bacterium]